MFFGMAKRKKKGWFEVTTEKMEAYALEINDQILIGDNVYKIYDIDELETPDQILFYIVDEEGIRHKIRVNDYANLPVVIDNLSQVW